MPPDGYMDAGSGASGSPAAVPVPDAGDDTLRERLADALTGLPPTAIYSDGTIKVVAEPAIDALLPLIREHVAAAVQAERERVLAVSESQELSFLERAERAEATIERAHAVHREHTNTGLVERCKCLACDMARALNGTGVSNGTR